MRGRPHWKVSWRIIGETQPVLWFAFRWGDGTASGGTARNPPAQAMRFAPPNRTRERDLRHPAGKKLAYSGGIQCNGGSHVSLRLRSPAAAKKRSATAADPNNGHRILPAADQLGVAPQGALHPGRPEAQGRPFLRQPRRSRGAPIGAGGRSDTTRVAPYRPVSSQETSRAPQDIK